MILTVLCFLLPSGEVKLYTKGADTMMYSLLKPGDDDLKDKTLQDLDAFSKDVRYPR